MKIFQEIGAYIAEDGSKFFSYAETKTHEEFAYLSKSLDTYGHEAITAAVNEAEKLYPEARKVLSSIFEHVRHTQAGMVVTQAMDRIESYLAPSNVAAAPTPDPARDPDGKPVTPSTTAPEPPKPPEEPEVVQRPDTTPRPSISGSEPVGLNASAAPLPPDDGSRVQGISDVNAAGVAAVATALTQVTPNPADDAVPPYTPTAASGVAAATSTFPEGSAQPGTGAPAQSSPPDGGAFAPVGGDPLATMKGIAAVETEKAQNGS